MARIVRLLLGLVALIVIVAFAVANRQPVDISFAPFPITLELPLYGAFLFGLIVGVLVGGIGVWLSGMSRRREARRLAEQGLGARESAQAAQAAGGESAGRALQRRARGGALQAAGD